MKKRKEPTAAQKRAAQEKRDRFRRLVRQVAEMPEDERQETFSNIGIVTCEGHPLSFTNTALSYLQNPKATMVGGFQQWIRNGRAVRKGEQGFLIWVPSARPSVASNDDLRFLTVTVFDVTQTDPIEAKESEAA